MSRGSATAARTLGRMLQRLREEAGKTQADAHRIGKRDKISRMENGKGTYSYADVKALADLWGADKERIARMVDLAEKTEAAGVYEDFSDVLPPWFATYFELEAVASVISTVELVAVPGLLQTEDYARAIFRVGIEAGAPEVIERQVRARRDRQDRIFGQRRPVRIEAVLWEAVLACRVGGAAVMEAQLQHLRHLTQDYDVQVRVLTWQHGAHAATEGAFSLLDFEADDDPSVTYLENYVGFRYLENPTHVAAYRKIFRSCYQQATPLEEYTP